MRKKTFDDLQTDIDSTNEGDTFYLNNSVYVSTGSSLNVSKSMALEGGDSQTGGNSTLDGKGLSRIMKISDNVNVTIKNIKFINGNATATVGGAIYSNGTVNVSDSSFVDNYVKYNGGAIWSNGNVSVVGSSFVNNSARFGGAISSFVPGNLSGNWWGSNSPDFTALLYGVDAPESYILFNISVNPNILPTLESSVVTVGFYNNITNKLVNISRPMSLTTDKGSLASTTNVLDSYFTTNFTSNVVGVNKITSIIDNEAQLIDVVVADDNNAVIKADNVSMFYHDGTRFVVCLVDNHGNPLANRTIYITINGVTYEKFTNGSGIASLALNLNSASVLNLIKITVKVSFSE